MRLNLQYPPSPEYAGDHAKLAVKAAKDVSGINLDYSVASLKSVDDIVEEMRQEGVSIADIGETLFAFGCYVGEVFIRNAKGTWVETSSTPMKGFAAAPMLIQLGPEHFANPIDKVFKRMESGKMESLPYFYQVFASKGG